MKSYHNTTGAHGDQLRIYSHNAKSQQEIILGLFQSYVKMTPSLVHKRMEEIGHSAPITSIRRAITNLTKAGMLIKTEQQVRGPWKHPEYIWKFHNQNHNQ